MNFVLERAGYPTLYLGLSHRKAYPDAIKPANDGNLEPIFRILYSIYIDQHREVVDQVRQKRGTGSLKLTGGDLAKEFLRLKKKWKCGVFLAVKKCSISPELNPHLWVDPHDCFRE